MEIYTIKEYSENAYEILGPNGIILKNHNHKPYPILSENISRNLIGDLNAIAEKHTEKESNAKSDEQALNVLMTKAVGNILRESFGYCLISSLMEYEEQQVDAQLDVYEQLQWDCLFRFNAAENGGTLELEATEKAIAFFGNNWRNFGLNYCDDFNEMEQNGVELVSDEIVEQVESLVAELHISQKVAVNILYNFFDTISITLPILWVSGKINDENYIKSFYALNYGIDIDSIDEDAYEEPRFLMNRLLYLKTIIWGYQWKDQSLPCVNF
jgi:hypothetical protein